MGRETMWDVGKIENKESITNHQTNPSLETIRMILSIIGEISEGQRGSII